MLKIRSRTCFTSSSLRSDRPPRRPTRGPHSPTLTSPRRDIQEPGYPGAPRRSWPQEWAIPAARRRTLQVPRSRRDRPPVHPWTRCRSPGRRSGGSGEGCRVFDDSGVLLFRKNSNLLLLVDRTALLARRGHMHGPRGSRGGPGNSNLSVRQEAADQPECQKRVTKSNLRPQPLLGRPGSEPGIGHRGAAVGSAKASYVSASSAHPWPVRVSRATN
jgi:hypothetical protein